MTALDEPPGLHLNVAPAAGLGWWGRVDRALFAIGDRLNPILVKETRQALKGRQFTITFTLVLICGWLWSIAGPALMDIDLAYGTAGRDMFMGYYVILSFA